MFYVPLAQYVNYPDAGMQRLEFGSHTIQAMLLVTNQPVGAIEPALRKALAEVDPNLTIQSVRTLAEQVALSFNQQRAVAGLAALFGSVALLLAAIGLYGVTAYSVAQRTNEIGVRMALGADRRRVMSYVLRGAFTWVIAGLVLGVPLAIGAGRFISEQLYNVKFWDPPALGFRRVGAGGGGAHRRADSGGTRAASISPMSALRAD